MNRNHSIIELREIWQNAIADQEYDITALQLIEHNGEFE